MVRSAHQGAWSEASTWENGRVPEPGDSVLIRPGHHVTYDQSSTKVIRAVHVGGVLKFATDRDTLLCVGLLRIAPGEDCAEEGFDCHALPREPMVPGNRHDGPALEIGTAIHPLDAKHTAVIRLTYLPDMPKESFPALMCCGGRLDLHGAPLNRSWVKLRETHYAGESQIALAEPITGWKAGDQIVIPTTEGSPFYTEDKNGRRIIASVTDGSQTEQHEISSVAGSTLTLKRPLKFKHEAVGRLRGEVANLSRNIIVESANPDGVRGHTMYHRNSAGSLYHVEFRHLGKEGVLGRYPIHFHQCGDTMRGSSVVGCSIWDSKNRWLTIHGTDYLVVRDCVGFRSTGHSFFFEDRTEVNNVMDRNLAVQALMGKPLPEQNLPFDTNDGAGFWLANCFNSFTRNVAAECDKHGFRFQMVKTDTFSPELRVRQADGRLKKVDVRTLPFINYVVWRFNIAGHDYNHVDFQDIHVSTFFNNWGSGNNRSNLLRYVDPVDDTPPSSVITRVDWLTQDTVRVTGVSVDDVRVKAVSVDGIPAELQDGPVTTWTAVLAPSAPSGIFEARASDDAGNVEKAAHRLAYTHPQQNIRATHSEPISTSQSTSPMPRMGAPAEARPPAERDQPVNTAGLKWPLWDGHQTVAEYARQLRLPATRVIELRGIPLELKLVPAGSFLMGSPPDEEGRSSDESPRHRVVISEPFYLGTCEITQKLYEKVMGANPKSFQGSGPAGRTGHMA